MPLGSPLIKKQSSRIELVGPPGVGKTTLYNALVKANNNEDIVSLTQASREYSSTEKFLNKIVFQLQNIFRCKPEQSFRVANLNKDDVSEWNTYLDAILLNLSRRTFDFDKRKTLFWILRNLNNAVLSEKYYKSAENERKFVLLDKGALTLAENAVNGWGLCPLPALTIFLECKPEMIAERILNRKQMNLVHRGKSFEQLVEISRQSLLIHENGAKVLKHRGGKIIVVNTENSIDNLIQEILNFLE